MSNNHILTRQIANLRGFSTDSIYNRPPNVAEIALNVQKAPDETLQIRRGYQCQIGQIGGMGLGSYDDPATNIIHTATINFDGYLYNKLQKQIYWYYDGRLIGNITGISNANPAVVHSPSHGLQTGAVLIIRNVGGMTDVNGGTYTITFVDSDHFSLNGFTSSEVYTSGGFWSIAFADSRYLTLEIFTDPKFILSVSKQSISCNLTANRAAKINGTPTNTNVLPVYFGHDLVTNDVVTFYDSSGTLQNRTVTGTTSTSITINGTPVTVDNSSYINQFFYIPFGKGFDDISIIPVTIAEFISMITDPVNGIFGLKIAINGDNTYPAAFIEIMEPTIILSSTVFTINYYYWQRVNFTLAPPFSGSADLNFQDSDDFEIASFETFDDVLYIANGINFPQKYDGQTVYRAGIQEGNRPSAKDMAATYQPFSMGQTYEYAITYEQVDNQGHIIEGVISDVFSHLVGTTPIAIQVTVQSLQAGSGWNTNCAIRNSTAITVYGPDANGFYYDYVGVNSGYTLKIGDSAYYLDEQAAQVNGTQMNVLTINVDPGHSVVVGDDVYFPDSVGPNWLQRTVTQTTPTSITIDGDPVSVTDDVYIQTYEVNKVFGDVGISASTQIQVNTISLDSGFNIQVSDVVEFIDSSNRLQRRNVTAVVPGVSITIDGIPIDINLGTLIYSLNQQPNSITFQRLNSGDASLSSGVPISNNLRINIYRTENLTGAPTATELFLVASIPNDSITGGNQTFIDQLADVELGREFDDPDRLPNPPPITKYLRVFGNQLFYAGGERGNSENSDLVFFSEGNQPEAVPLATNFFNTPNDNDDITGIGVSGSTLVTTKKTSLWGTTGNFLTGQINTFTISPGTNIGCVSHASIASVGILMFFCSNNGVYSITENQLFPTDKDGTPIALSDEISVIFRTKNFSPLKQFVFKRSVGINYSKDLQYWLFLPCETPNSQIRTANSNSIILCYDYEFKNWFMWDNMNAAGGMTIIDDDIYFQERRFSGISGNTANLYKQHRFYRLIDHADHAGPQIAEWRGSWEDLGQPRVRKKFNKCMLLLDRISDLQQFNNPTFEFSTYLDRLPNLQSTIADVFQVDNVRNVAWSTSGWGWNYWSGYQDSFISVNLKGGTVSKSIQMGIKLQGINFDMKFAGYQFEAIPENRKTMIR